jgi:hypothetical protein
VGDVDDEPLGLEAGAQRARQPDLVVDHQHAHPPIVARPG